MATPDTNPSKSPAAHHGTPARAHRSRLLSLLDGDADDEPGIGACHRSLNYFRPIHSPFASASWQHSLRIARATVLLVAAILVVSWTSVAEAAPLPGHPSQAFFPRSAESGTASEATTTTSSGEGLSSGQKVTYGIVVPILIVLSGIFAGLTLGYMSLDETQLAVLAAQGSPKEQEAARRIMPIRKDGHLLLTTLLIANMITNETLPIVADPLLGGGWKAVLFSIVVIVIFAELIPQSVCSRYGLSVGSKMVFPVRIVIILLWPVAYPVSRILHWALGPHQGIIYRRPELKELVGIHAATGGHGGDLKSDTVLIVGGALDLQAKTVRVAMTPIQDVFMLPITAKLDYPTLGRVLNSGHSRVPIYVDDSAEAQEALAAHNLVTPTYSSGSTIDLPSESSLSVEKTLTKTAPSGIESTPTELPSEPAMADQTGKDATEALNDKDTPEAKNTVRHPSKRIIGTLLVKSCVLLDPEDAVPVREMVINEMPTVPANESLLHLLNVFQQGRSHMAVVSRAHPVDTAITAPGAEPIAIPESKETDWAEVPRQGAAEDPEKGAAKPAGSEQTSPRWWHRFIFWRKRRGSEDDAASVDSHARTGAATEAVTDGVSESNGEFDLLEDEAQNTDSETIGPSDEPLGIITLEDVLEELLGSEIWDEYDEIGPSHGAVTAMHPSILSSAGLTSAGGQSYLSFSSLRPGPTTTTGGSGTPAGGPSSMVPSDAVSVNATGPTSGQSTPREVLSLPPTVMAPALSRLLAPLRRTPSQKDVTSEADTTGAAVPNQATPKITPPSSTPAPRTVATYQMTRPHSGDKRTGLPRAVQAHVLASDGASSPLSSAHSTPAPSGTATPLAQSPTRNVAVPGAASATANAAAVTAAAAATARGRTPGTIPVLFPVPTAEDKSTL